MGARNTKFTSSLRQDGRTAVITGSNTGIGKATAKELYKLGARVIMACRDVSKAEDAKKEIEKETGTDGNVGVLIIRELDLSSLASIKECSDQILQFEDRINLLINNAGIMMCPKSKTRDGFEMQFGVNHLGHFLFTNLLLPRICASAPSRIINVSSSGHLFGEMKWEDLNWETRPYSAMAAYQQSKLANVLFTVELANQLKGSGVTTYSVHPGIVRTDLGRYLDNTYFAGSRTICQWLFSLFLKSPKEGALTTLYCALDEKVAEESGLYYSCCRVAVPSAAARDMKQAKKLWDISAKMVNLEYFMEN